MSETKKNNEQASPKTIKKTQYRNLGMVAIVILVLFSGTYYLLESENNPKSKSDPSQEVRFTNAIGDKEVYSASIEKFQSQVAENKKTEDQLKTQIIKLQQQALKNKPDANLAQKYQTLVSQFAKVEEQLKQLKANPPQPIDKRFKTVNATYGNQTFPTIPGQANGAYNENGFSIPAIATDGDDHLQLVAHKTKRNVYPRMNPNTYLPAGTHVLGVLLQGADLVADSYDQQNPKPILIRLVSSGTLPNHHLSHLRGCVITAAMTGDISSGRGDVRLERLSCVRPNNSIIDVPVFGTISTNAKEGISGQIYTREGSRLFDAALSGTAAGVASGVSQGYVQYQNSVFGPVGTVDSSDLLKYGAAKGAATGLNKLSDFEMDRADQIHPIIQVNGGKLVTVTFLKGFFFDGKHTHDVAESSNPWAKPKQDNRLLTSSQMVTDLLQGDQ